MSNSTFTSRKFNQNTSEAKRAANRGPVFITDRGKPSHVLLSIDQYQRLTSSERRIADLLWMPGADDVDLPAGKSTEIAKVAEF